MFSTEYLASGTLLSTRSCWIWIQEQQICHLALLRWHVSTWICIFCVCVCMCVCVFTSFRPRHSCKEYNILLKCLNLPHQPSLPRTLAHACQIKAKWLRVWSYCHSAEWPAQYTHTSTHTHTHTHTHTQRHTSAVSYICQSARFASAGVSAITTVYLYLWLGRNSHWDWTGAYSRANTHICIHTHTHTHTHTEWCSQSHTHFQTVK